MKQFFLYLINPVTMVAIIFLLGLISSRVKNKLKFYVFALSIFVISSTPIFSYIFSYPLIHAVKTANEDRLRNIETVIVLSAGIKKNVIGDWVPSNDSVDRVTLGKYYSENLSVPLREARENFEKEYLISQIKKFGGNISKTAKFVGMERSALHRKLKLLGVKDLN